MAFCETLGVDQEVGFRRRRVGGQHTHGKLSEASLDKNGNVAGYHTSCHLIREVATNSHEEMAQSGAPSYRQKGARGRPGFESVERLSRKEQMNMTSFSIDRSALVSLIVQISHRNQMSVRCPSG